MGIVSRIINKITGKKETKIGDVGNIQSGSGAPTQKVYYTPAEVKAKETPSTPNTGVVPSRGGGGGSSRGGGGGSSGGGGGGSSAPQSLGGGAYIGTPTDTGTGQVITKVTPKTNTASFTGGLSTQVGSDKPATYFSSKDGWVPQNKNAVVVYIGKDGRTTGKTSIAGLDVESNIKVDGRYRTTDNKTIYGRDLFSFEFNTQTNDRESFSIGGNNNDGMIFDLSGLPSIETTNWDKLGGTRTDYGLTDKNIKIETQPYITRRVVDTFTAPDTGNKIPVTKTFYVDPTVMGEQFERPATTEEISFFESNKELVAKTDKQFIPYVKIKGSVVGAYENLNQGFKESYTDPLGSFIVEKTKGTSFGGETGLTLDKAQKNILETSDYLKESGVPNWIVNSGEFISGVGVGVVEDIKYKPLKNAVIYGASFGAGALIGGGSSLIGTIPKVGKGLQTGLKISELGAGAYFGGGFVLDTATRAYFSDTPLEAGKITGVAVKDITIAGFGFSGGKIAATKAEGYFRTRGREFIEIKQGEFPQSATNKQLDLFKQNEIPELGSKPGAFHTTSDVFWKDTITPKAGTSELPGLYGSTQISTPFSRISGSGANKKFFPNIKELFTPSGKPGVAYLQPEGFRYSRAIKGTNVVNGQSFSYRWVNPAKPGYADVPLIKTEIEAIFRPDAGSYGFTGGKYFTNIKGIRVPIDTFAYSGAGGNTVNVLGLNLKGGSGSYSLPTSQAIFSPGAFSITSITSQSNNIVYPSLSKSFFKSSSLTGSSSFDKSLMPSSMFGGSKSKGKSYGSSLFSSSSFDKSLTSSSIFGGSKSKGKSSSSYFPYSRNPSPISNFKFPFKDKDKSRSKKGKAVKGQYAPTITAIGLNLKSNQIDKLYKAGAGAFSIRPLIQGGKSGRRKKRR